MRGELDPGHALRRSHPESGLRRRAQSPHLAMVRISWCVLPVVVQANGRLSGEDSWTDGTERLRSARGQRFSVGARAVAWLFLRNFASAATHPAVARAVSHTEQQICGRPAWSSVSRADTRNHRRISRALRVAPHGCFNRERTSGLYAQRVASQVRPPAFSFRSLEGCRGRRGSGASRRYHIQTRMDATVKHWRGHFVASFEPSTVPSRWWRWQLPDKSNMPLDMRRDVAEALVESTTRYACRES